MSRGRTEHGAASLLATACLGVLFLLGATLAVVGALLADHRRAQSGADLAALAGASALQRGREPCLDAGRVAVANRTVLTGCRVEDGDVLVSVRILGPTWLGRTAELQGHARAGPG